MRLSRLLFASTHGYFDPSSGAALATRDLLELLVANEVDCRVFSTGILDFERETPLESVLGSLGVPGAHLQSQTSWGDSAEVIDVLHNGVRATLVPTLSSRADRSPDPTEARVFLDLGEQILDRFRPEILLTYGGHPVGMELIRRARQRGIAVIFHLHNFGYDSMAAFRYTSAALVPSEYSCRYYERRLGLRSTSIPYPLHPERVVARDPSPRYLTFINPQPPKGVTVFARIALELQRRRPEIPILVVEGRGTAGWLARIPLDLSGVENLHQMANTPDPRQFYGVSRAVLVPSLWRESFGRVAAEALANRLPVLASDRGALAETLGDAGFVFTVPERCTPTSGEIPTAREVAPWVATVERLWDDAEFVSDHQERAEREAERWDNNALVRSYKDFFGTVLGNEKKP